jgi:hypothetical protein
VACSPASTSRQAMAALMAVVSNRSRTRNQGQYNCLESFFEACLCSHCGPGQQCLQARSL